MALNILQNLGLGNPGQGPSSCATGPSHLPTRCMQTSESCCAAIRKGNLTVPLLQFNKVCLLGQELLEQMLELRQAPCANNKREAC